MARPSKPPRAETRRTYWLDLFTGTTWDEFRSAGGHVSGFRASQVARAKRIKPGDVFLCYLTGVMRWVGALEVVGTSKDATKIWSIDEFPVRFGVKPLIVLTPEHGVPMDQLQERVSFYEGPKDKGGFKGFLRSSPHRFGVEADATTIMELLEAAAASPVRRAVDPKKLARVPTYKVERKRGRRTVEAMVSIPEKDEEESPAAAFTVPDDEAAPAGPSTRHTEIQYHLTALGAEMGLDVWVARNDRSKSFNGKTLGEMTQVLGTLPLKLDDATMRTVELIDVLWLRRNSVVAAFEVECTTSVYSGLLRMSDLISLQPNLDIKLYIVAPDEKRTKVENEIVRPTFAMLDKPLHSVCGFLPFSQLMEKVEGIRALGIGASLSPDFLEKVAEYFGDRE